MKPSDAELKVFKDTAAAWAQERLADSATVIIDTETTGLPSKDPDTEICQLAITDIKGRSLLTMLVKPNKPMKEEVVEIHKITNDQVQFQPIFPQIAPFVSYVLKNKHVVCWNSDFDVKLLWSLFRKYKLDLPKIAGASCAMDKYSEFIGEWNERKDGFKWQKLPNLSGMPAHDAFSDCVSTIRVMELMAGQYDHESLTAEDIDLNF
jgi:DNA polymerase-3 subunit epsilon